MKEVVCPVCKKYRLEVDFCLNCGDGRESSPTLVRLAELFPEKPSREARPKKTRPLSSKRKPKKD